LEELAAANVFLAPSSGIVSEQSGKDATAWEDAVFVIVCASFIAKMKFR